MKNKKGLVYVVGVSLLSIGTFSMSPLIYNNTDIVYAAAPQNNSNHNQLLDIDYDGTDVRNFNY